MLDPKILKFYARKDIQEEIAKLAKNRELAVRYSNGSFGKRPDVLQYPSDVLELARQGVSSFHFSEERWSDPLQLRSGMSKKHLDDLEAVRSELNCESVGRLNHLQKMAANVEASK